jgi:AcrR family transcriptional regulator
MQSDAQRVLQRERILRAMMEVVAERGYAAASVEVVVVQAGVSRRTFYGCFANRDECFRDLLDLASARTAAHGARRGDRARFASRGTRADQARREAPRSLTDGSPRCGSLRQHFVW